MKKTILIAATLTGILMAMAPAVYSENYFEEEVYSPEYFLEEYKNEEGDDWETFSNKVLNEYEWLDFVDYSKYREFKGNTKAFLAFLRLNGQCGQ